MPYQTRSMMLKRAFAPLALLFISIGSPLPLHAEAAKAPAILIAAVPHGPEDEQLYTSAANGIASVFARVERFAILDASAFQAGLASTKAKLTLPSATDEAILSLAGDADYFLAFEIGQGRRSLHCRLACLGSALRVVDLDEYLPNEAPSTFYRAATGIGRRVLLLHYFDYQGPVLSASKDIYVAATSFAGTAEMDALRAYGGIADSTLKQDGRLHVRREIEDKGASIPAFVAAIDNYREVNFVVPDNFLFGSAAMTNEDLEKIVRDYYLVAPSLLAKDAQAGDPKGTRRFALRLSVIERSGDRSLVSLELPAGGDIVVPPKKSPETASASLGEEMSLLLWALISDSWPGR